jgi:hypothetical protein
MGRTLPGGKVMRFLTVNASHPGSQAITGPGPRLQNGRTTAMTTTITMSSAGTSFITR